MGNSNKKIKWWFIILFLLAPPLALIMLGLHYIEKKLDQIHADNRMFNDGRISHE